MIKFWYLFVLCFVVVMSSCAHNMNMALTKGQPKIDVTKNSIALLSVKISKQYDYIQLSNQRVPADCMPAITGVNVCSQSGKCTFYNSEAPYKRKENISYEYLMSFEIESGTYNFHPYNSCDNVGTKLTTEIKSNSVIYLGHIDIIKRIYIGMFGYPDYRLDFVVKDDFDEDMKLFIANYPALQNVIVDRYILKQK